MNYLERIIQKQKALAENFDTQAAALPKERAVFPIGPQTDQTGRGLTAASAQNETEAEGVRTLYEKWNERSAASEKIAVLRRIAMEKLEKSRLAQVSAVPEKTDAEADGAGTAAVFHAQTALPTDHRAAGTTMADISRFFERDARRYGGGE